MAYSLHIEIPEDEIELDEWLEAVETVDEAKLLSNPTNASNNNTNEVISFESNCGDVSVLINSEWVTCIFFSNGIATFNAVDDIESPKNPVHIVASKLAGILGAQIVGDEGEIYEW